MQNELVNFCLKKGLLLDDETLKIFNNASDVESVKIIIEGLKRKTQKNIITMNLLEQNKDVLNSCISNLPEENQRRFETIRLKLGLDIEISREIVDYSVSKKEQQEVEQGFSDVRVLTNPFFSDKKLELKDFVNYFRNRYEVLRNILSERSELKNLVSLNKISSNSNNFCVIGMILDKRITKNKNILLEIEDLTGRSRVLINSNKQELLEKAENITLDSVIAFKVSGNREILFANEIYFPDSVLPFRKKSNKDENILFIGDLHIGSVRFMKDNFLKFIDYLNSNEEEARKTNYLVIVGDLVAGVGNYPNQEAELDVKDLEEQFILAAELLRKIRKDIKIIISPGNHDGIRIMEPQPMFDEKFAWALYELENVIIATNPSQINLGAYSGFDGFNLLLYHGFSYIYYADNIFSLMKQKAVHKPDLIMKYLLLNRHLAPTHGSTQYFPGEKDIHLIENVPDILVSGHLHKSEVSYYNNILVISVSTWESMTDYMEKVGSKPDFCKVPMFNLKTRQVKILDFE